MEKYSQDEIREKFQSITAAQRRALSKIARVCVRDTRHGHDDLICEALVRVLDGRRTWPRSVETLPFLHGVMRSIASEWRDGAVTHA
jgi:hypothetical protein